MTPSAIRAYCLVMHIGMTIHTSRKGFSENKALVALSAVKHPMLARKRHGRFIMVERIDRLVEFPAIRTMAKITAEFKIFTMGRISSK